jgi:hypothetical protein
MKKNCILFITISFFSFSSIAQHVGIGTTSPANPLHIKSASEPEMLRIEGPTPYISFFNGTTYKGYVWYDGNKMVLGTSTPEPVVISPYYTISPFYFMPTGRLGLGISNPAEKLDVDGNINLNGVLKVNGSSGITGQVLTSNGSGDPSWKDAAYNNAVRFSFNMFADNEAEDTMEFSLTNYNLNPATITISGTSLTINQTGLYHFEIYLFSEIGYFSPINYMPSVTFDLKVGIKKYQLCAFRALHPESELPTTAFGDGNKFIIDLYISAPSVIKLNRLYEGLAANPSIGNQGSYITGYLVNN